MRPAKHDGAERLAYYGGPAGFGSANNASRITTAVGNTYGLKGFSADVETFERALKPNRRPYDPS
jgi:hypothetical protein